MDKALTLGVVIGAKLGNSYFSTFDNAKQKAQKLGSVFEANDKKLKAANGVIKYRNLLGQLKRKQIETGGSSDKLASTIRRVEQRYDNAKNKAQQYSISVGNVVAQQKRLQVESNKLVRVQSALNNQQMAANNLGALKGRALGVAGGMFGISRIMDNSFELEDKNLQLGDVITGDNVEQRLEASIAHARAFAKNALASESDVLEIDYALRSSGLNDEAAMFGSEIVSKVTTVTKGNAGDVGFIIGDTLNNMGDRMVGTTEEKMARIGDVLTNTKNLFSIKDFNQLGEGLKESLGSAIQNNVSLEQTAALIGQINNGMLKGSQAGTGLNALLRQMPKAMDKIDFDMVRGDDGELDVIATLESMQYALDGMDIDEKAMLLQDAFGDEGKKALVPLLANLEKLKTNFEKVKNSSDGVLDEGYQRRLNSASGQWLMFKQNVLSLGTTLADDLLPPLGIVFGALATGAGALGDVIEAFPTLSYVIGGVTVGFFGYVAVLGTVSSIQWAYNTTIIATSRNLGFLGNIFSITRIKALALGTAMVSVTVAQKAYALGSIFLSTTLNTLGGALRLVGTSILWVGRAFLMNPIGLAITAIGMGAALIYKYWEPISDFFSNLWDGIAEGVESFASSIGDALESIPGFSWLKEKLGWDEDKDVKVGLNVSDDDAQKVAELGHVKPKYTTPNRRTMQNAYNASRPMQSNQIQIDIHNPKDTVDVEKAVVNAMAHSTSNVPLEDREF